MIFDFFKKPKTNVRAGNMKPVVLVVLDGWGIAPPSEGNAISLANPPNFNQYLKIYPNTQLLAAGEAVGLPAGEVGNTEVGHLSLGAGRVILQDLMRIDKSIEEGSFYENKAFYHALFHAQKNNSKIHIMGLVGSGNVHSSSKHLYALLEFYKRAKFNNIYLHVFTDGRDSDPRDAVNAISKLEEYLKINGMGKIATIAGRYYAMDRDKRWDRTDKAYQAMVKGVGEVASDAVSALKASYAKDITDEFVLPTVINKDGLIRDSDAAIFFNYRIDRPRQLTMAFVVKDFKNSNISWEFDPYAVMYDNKHTSEKENLISKEPFSRGTTLQNLFFVTMTEYQNNLPVSEIAFPLEEVVDSLPVILSQRGLNQMHISESEKERFVTYYFNGLRQDRQKGESVLIVPSPKVATYDKKPEMSVATLAEEFKKVLNEDKYQFIVMNIANADMVAHTGNKDAAKKAIIAIDNALKEIVDSVLVCNGTILITADHGNAEEMMTYKNSSFFFTSDKGIVNTNHSSNPVPLLVINKSFANSGKKIATGKLADVAPTILKLLNLDVPPVMTGRNLIS